MHYVTFLLALITPHLVTARRMHGRTQFGEQWYDCYQRRMYTRYSLQCTVDNLIRETDEWGN